MEEIIILKTQSTRIPFVPFQLNDETNFFEDVAQTKTDTIFQEFINFFELPPGTPEDKKKELMRLATTKGSNNLDRLREYYTKYYVPINELKKIKVKKTPNKPQLAEALIKLYDELKDEFSEAKQNKNDEYDETFYSEEEEEDFYPDEEF